MDAAYRSTTSSGEPTFNMRDAAHSPLLNRAAFPHPLEQLCTALEVTSMSTDGPAHRRALITLPTASEHGPPLQLCFPILTSSSTVVKKSMGGPEEQYERPNSRTLALVLLPGGNAPSEWGCTGAGYASRRVFGAWGRTGTVRVAWQ